MRRIQRAGWMMWLAFAACGGKEGEEDVEPGDSTEVDMDTTANTDDTDDVDDTGETSGDAESNTTGDTGSAGGETSDTGLSTDTGATVCAYILRDGSPALQTTHLMDGRVVEELVLSTAGGVAQTTLTTYEEDEPWKISSVYRTIFPGPPQETPIDWDWVWTGNAVAISVDGEQEEHRTYREDGELLTQDRIDTDGDIYWSAEWVYLDATSWKVSTFTQGDDEYVYSWSGDEATITLDGLLIQRATHRSDGQLLSVEVFDEDGAIDATTTFTYLSPTSWQLSDVTTVSSTTSTLSYDWAGCP